MQSFLHTSNDIYNPPPNRLIKAVGMDGMLQSEGPWTLLAPTDAVLDDAGFNVRACVRAATYLCVYVPPHNLP